MPTVHELIAKVQEFASLHRREGLKPFEVSGLYDLFPHLAGNGIAADFRWPESWPNSPHAGVYAVFGVDASLVYVGKSSMNSFLGARLSAHFGNMPDKTCRIKEQWRIAPRYLVTIAVPDQMTWEAPALEEFLIQRLNPPLNCQGRSV